MNIRPAELADALEIGTVHVRSWQATYRGLVPQSFLDGLDPARRGEGWARYLSQRDPGSEPVLVAETNNDLVGFISLGPSRDEDANRAGEVRAIYLLANQWGQGLGKALMEAGLDLLRQAGFSEATLWVLDTNDRARGFYEACGWTTDGAEKSDDSRGFAITEVRYRRSLST